MAQIIQFPKRTTPTALPASSKKLKALEANLNQAVLVLRQVEAESDAAAASAKALKAKADKALMAMLSCEYLVLNAKSPSIRIPAMFAQA